MTGGAVVGEFFVIEGYGLPAIGRWVAVEAGAGVMLGRLVGGVARPALCDADVVKLVGNPRRGGVAVGAVAGKVVGVWISRCGAEGGEE